MMNLSNAKYFVFDMKTAVEQDMKGNGLYDLESAVDISGIYQVLYVTSYFEMVNLLNILKVQYTHHLCIVIL